jgi:nucleotide-binding universal stress UspA family protein
VPEVDSCDVLVLGREILKVVADEHVDLVVMGVQGKGVINRLVFGSTTHRVIREAACPVLTLHTGSVGVQ